ncbi:hypothetical protein GCM10009076_29620 [Erythrobacter ramosus]
MGGVDGIVDALIGNAATALQGRRLCRTDGGLRERAARGPFPCGGRGFADHITQPLERILPSGFRPSQRRAPQ